VSASARDGLDVSPLTLPDGISNNQIGGFGSAIAYTGVGNLYLVAPDRGPDNGAVEFTDRFYQIELGLRRRRDHAFGGGAKLNQALNPFVGLATASIVPTHRRAAGSIRGYPRQPEGTFFVSDDTAHLA
jgi:hypothetical protein